MANENLDELLHQLISYPNQRQEILSAVCLTVSERKELFSLLLIADLLWLQAQKPPALIDDKVAVLLDLT